MPTEKKPLIKLLLLISYFIFSAFVCIIPALYNRYPLFYSDSALYIDTSMLFGKLQPGENIQCLSGIGYAFFIRAVTWKTTLWLVVYAQALILNILIYLTIKVLLPDRNALKYHFPLIFVLSICSSMGWTVSQLMPDIFTPYLVLSLFLFYTTEGRKWIAYISLSILILISLISHMSNVSIVFLFIIVLAMLFIFHKKYRSTRKPFLIKTVYILGLVFISFFILKGLNKKYYNEYVLSPKGHIWFFARLIDTGFMQEYLNEKCDQESYEICKYKDSLPDNSQTFLWDEGSVYYKTGGWAQNHDEYKKIIGDVMVSPKYLNLFLYSGFTNFLKQMVTFKIGDGLSDQFNRGSPQYQLTIKNYDRNEFKNDFQQSEQIQGSLKFDTINLINCILIFFSLLLIVYIFYTKKLERNLHLFSYIIFCGVIFNAIVISNLSAVQNRYQSRIVWLIPFLAIIYFYLLLYPSLKKIVNNLIKPKD
jgi:hypothetical protein